MGIMGIILIMGAAGFISSTVACTLEAQTQRVHMHYRYGLRSQKTIPILALGTPQFHSRP